VRRLYPFLILTVLIYIPHQQCNFPLSPHPLQHLPFLLLLAAVLTEVRWYLIMVCFAFLWVLVTLTNFFICLLVICVFGFLFEKFLVRFLVGHCLNGLLFFPIEFVQLIILQSFVIKTNKTKLVQCFNNVL
jgi:hypothetical protein